MEEYERSALVDAVASGTAILILGDLADMARTYSLEIARVECLSALNVDPGANIKLEAALKALRSRDRDCARSIIAKHLARQVNDRGSLVRLIQAPWDRIYSMGGANFDGIDFHKLSHAVHRVSSNDPSLVNSMSTLLIDDSMMEDAAEVFLDKNRGAQRELWLQEVHARTLLRQVVVLARRSHDALWECLRERAPDSTTACLVVLEDICPDDIVTAMNVGASLIKGTVADLSNALPAGNAKLGSARRVLARSRKGAAVGTGVQLVSSLLRPTGSRGDWNFLRGYDPTWQDVAQDRLLILQGFRNVRDAAKLTEGERNTVVVKGRSGSGKTALLMQFAAYLATSRSSVVMWIDRTATQSLRKLEDEVLEVGPDCVVVDDADIFGERAPDLLRRLNRSGETLVLASVRTTRERVVGRIGGAEYLSEVPLSDDDIKGIEALLRKAGLLGSLQGVEPRQTRLDRIRSLCQRDLLAALIQIVTGQKFEERIQSEFEQLDPLEQRLYLTLAVFIAYVNEAKQISDEDLLRCVDDTGFSRSMHALESLIDKRLIVMHAAWGVGVRHRAIADVLVAQQSGPRIAEVVGALLRYFASLAHAIHDSSHPDRRTMIALLSHKLMVRLDLTPGLVRPIYESVRPLLALDFHYWLQAGAYEIERGDLELARSYLDSARSCPGGLNDYKVTTEWGILKLMYAQHSPDDYQVANEAHGALLELIRVAEVQGSNSPHTFKILAGEGDRFLASSRFLTEAEKGVLRAHLDRIVGIGLVVCKDNGVAMDALMSYQKRRSSTVRPQATPPRTFPMPKPGPPKRRRL